MDQSLSSGNSAPDGSAGESGGKPAEVSAAPAADGVLSELPPLVTKVLVWGLLIALLYTLRSFFLLLFLTFVFSYIQAQAVERLNKFIPRRNLCVLLTGTFFLGIIIAIGVFIVPQVALQAKLLADRYPNYLKTIDLEIVELSHKYPVLGEIIPEHMKHEVHLSGSEHEGEVAGTNGSVTALVLKQLLGFDEKRDSDEDVRRVLHLLRDIGKPLLSVGSAFLLSLLFSVLLVYDLPRLRESTRGLAHTKLAFVYHEVADGIREFGTQLGRALGAQLVIALVNTVLSVFIILYLGLGSHLAFLSLIVFICSFVPIAGVFFSSVPICLLTMQISGFQGVIVAILLIWLVHLIEAYVVNPRIFGERMHINPVLVLIILTISGKLFGLWGLVLSLPICTYFFGYAIRHEPQAQTGRTSP